MSLIALTDIFIQLRSRLYSNHFNALREELLPILFGGHLRCSLMQPTCLANRILKSNNIFTCCSIEAVPGHDFEKNVQIQPLHECCQWLFQDCNS